MVFPKVVFLRCRTSARIAEIRWSMQVQLFGFKPASLHPPASVLLIGNAGQRPQSSANYIYTHLYMYIYIYIYILYIYIYIYPV